MLFSNVPVKLVSIPEGTIQSIDPDSIFLNDSVSIPEGTIQSLSLRL